MANDTNSANSMTTTTTTQAAPLAKPAALVAEGHDDGRSLNAFSSSAAFAVGQRMATALSQSNLVPKEYQGQANIPNVMIAMELANRTGASVFSVMQNIDIIHGRPSWRATFLIATVNACGRFTPLRFRFQGKEGTDDFGCRAVAKDRETSEECLGALITIGLAKAEGWATKNGSKWRTMPEQMLLYRAAAFWSRVYAPELSLGMRTVEESEEVPEFRQVISPGDPKVLEAALLATPTPVEAPRDRVIETKVVATPDLYGDDNPYTGVEK